MKQSFDSKHLSIIFTYIPCIKTKRKLHQINHKTHKVLFTTQTIQLYNYSYSIISDYNKNKMLYNQEGNIHYRYCEKHQHGVIDNPEEMILRNLTKQISFFPNLREIRFSEKTIPFISSLPKYIERIGLPRNVKSCDVYSVIPENQRNKIISFCHTQKSEIDLSEFPKLQEIEISIQNVIQFQHVFHEFNRKFKIVVWRLFVFNDEIVRLIERVKSEKKIVKIENEDVLKKVINYFNSNESNTLVNHSNDNSTIVSSTNEMNNRNTNHRYLKNVTFVFPYLKESIFSDNNTINFNKTNNNQHNMKLIFYDQFERSNCFVMQPSNKINFNQILSHYYPIELKFESNNNCNKLEHQ